LIISELLGILARYGRSTLYVAREMIAPGSRPPNRQMRTLDPAKIPGQNPVSGRWSRAFYARSPSVTLPVSYDLIFATPLPHPSQCLHASPRSSHSDAVINVLMFRLTLFSHSQESMVTMGILPRHTSTIHWPQIGKWLLSASVLMYIGPGDSGDLKCDFNTKEGADTCRGCSENQHASYILRKATRSAAQLDLIYFRSRFRSNHCLSVSFDQMYSPV